jgi:hypothetical protein
LSFSLFAERAKDLSAGVKRPAREVASSAWDETIKRLRPLVGQGIELSTKLSPDERVEVNEFTRRLLKLFLSENKTSIVRPMFRGCGYIDSSEGDVINVRTLYEIKTVDRLFRSHDLRQVITYAALNYASKQFEIERVGLFNPRSGYVCEFPIDEVCREISGISGDEFLARLVNVVSSSDISR